MHNFEIKLKFVLLRQSFHKVAMLVLSAVSKHKSRDIGPLSPRRPTAVVLYFMACES